jgi:uncharacterized protein YqgC (DUF456 family)
MTKKFGGSRIAVIGSVLGLVIGMLFFAPLGLIIGPFFGAFAGELIYNHIQVKRNKTNTATYTDGNKKALKAAFGAFLAFILGTGAKLIVSSMMIYYAVKAMFFRFLYHQFL